MEKSNKQPTLKIHDEYKSIEGIIKYRGEKWEIGYKPQYFTEWTLNAFFKKLINEFICRNF